jgi:hypothetical protein
MTTPRNSPCKCGSGKKYKHCHGHHSIAPSLQNEKNYRIPSTVLHGITQHIILQQKRQEWPLRYGAIMPAVHIKDSEGNLMIAVGNQLFKSSGDKTWHGFLYDHLQIVLGQDWFEKEAIKDADQMHLILKWFKEVCTIELDENGQFTKGKPGVETNICLAFRSLAYDFFCLRQSMHALSEQIRRLKTKDGFEGARYEIWVAACFARAGFELNFIDETVRSKTHCEFTVYHPKFEKTYSVEVRRKHRPNLVNHEQQKNAPLNIHSLLAEGLKKDAEHEKIIFIDVNLPRQSGPIINANWMDSFKATIGRVERQKPYREKRAFLFATNHPYHYSTDETPNLKTDFLGSFVNMPDLFKAPYLVYQKAPVISHLAHSIADHFDIPRDFPPTNN